MTIYTFSATGNSLTTARALAERLGGCTLVPVPSTRRAPKIIEPAGAVGFVFPVYYGTMPYPVRELICKMVFEPEAYIFIVTTFRGHAGAVAQKTDQLLKTRGQKLSLALGIPMPGNSFINEPHVDQGYLDNQLKNVEELLDPIRAREVRDYAQTGVLPMRPVESPSNFRGIMADDSCTGCGTCAKVCPMDNITIQDGRAAIGDLCASCLACFHWCPQQSIFMSQQENIARRPKYHHPGVTLQDIIAQK